MSDMHYLGEIVMFGGTYAPRGWAFCDGRLLEINQNEALFSLLGDRYGGDSLRTFGLPNLKSRFPTHPEVQFPLMGGGFAQLNTDNLPSHTHNLNAAVADGTSESPAGKVLADAKSRYPTNVYIDTPTNMTKMHNTSIGTTGNSVPLKITPPYTAVNFIICLEGIYPPRN